MQRTTMKRSLPDYAAFSQGSPYQNYALPSAGNYITLPAVEERPSKRRTPSPASNDDNCQSMPPQGPPADMRIPFDPARPSEDVAMSPPYTNQSPPRSPSGIEEACVTPKTGRWTKREDEMLRDAVKEYGPKQNWKRISDEAFHGLRTDVQCLHRWQKVLKPGLKKGQWTEEEDEVVRKQVELMGGPQNVKWSTVAEFLPGRLGKQVRERWQNHLDPALTKEPWGEEEDQLLISLQAVMGNRWSEIARAFAGRSENSVKNRWNSKQRKSLALERKKRTGSELGVWVRTDGRQPQDEKENTIKIDFRKALQAANRSISNVNSNQQQRPRSTDEDMKDACMQLLGMKSKEEV